MTGRYLQACTLNDAMNNLNSRMRTDGLSAREIFFQRDQFTNAQIPVEDMHIIQSKHNRAVNNNLSSELSKSGGRGPRINQSIQVVDLVYLISDRSKNSPRDRYLVVSIEDEWCNIRKFIGNTLKSNSYRVKMVEIYKVPSTTLPMQQPHQRYLLAQSLRLVLYPVNNNFTHRLDHRESVALQRG